MPWKVFAFFLNKLLSSFAHWIVINHKHNWKSWKLKIWLTRQIYNFLSFFFNHWKSFNGKFAWNLKSFQSKFRRQNKNKASRKIGERWEMRDERVREVRNGREKEKEKSFSERTLAVDFWAFSMIGKLKWKLLMENSTSWDENCYDFLRFFPSIGRKNVSLHFIAKSCRISQHS